MLHSHCKQLDIHFSLHSFYLSLVGKINLGTLGAYRALLLSLLNRAFSYAVRLLGPPCLTPVIWCSALTAQRHCKRTITPMLQQGCARRSPSGQRLPALTREAHALCVTAMDHHNLCCSL